MKSFQFWLSNNYRYLLLLTALVSLTYVNSLGNAFVSDDIAAIRDNPDINKVSNFLPLTNIPFRFHSFVLYVNNQLFGNNPITYRLTYVSLHLVTAVIVYVLAGKMFLGYTPIIAACLFAVHPLLSESVVWISAGGYIGYSLFSLVSLLFYTSVRQSKKKWLLYFLSIMFFLLALSASEKAVVLPIILLAYEIIFNRLSTKTITLTPYFLVSGLFSLIYFLTGQISDRLSNLETQYYQIPATINPLVQIPVSISSYLQLIVWPNGLTLYHSEMQFTPINYLIRLLVFLLYMGTAIYFVKKDRRVSFWLLFFLMSLLPTLTPWGLSWIVAERYAYLGSIGIFIFFAYLIDKLSNKLAITSNKNYWYVLLAILIIPLSIRSIVRNADWKNQDTLWLAAAKTSPSSPQNHNNLGDYYGRQGNLDKAAEEFKIAIQLNPQYGDAYHNLGNVYQQMKKYDLALESFQKAISLNPNLWQSYANIGGIYYQQKNYPKAAENLLQAIIITPNNDTLYAGLGIVYLEQGEEEKAGNAFRQALTINPKNQLAISGAEKLK